MARGFQRGGYRQSERVTAAKQNLQTFMLEQKQQSDLETVEASKKAAKVKAATTGKDLYSKYLHNKASKVMKTDKIKEATTKLFDFKSGGMVDVNTYGRYGDNAISEMLGLEAVGVNPKLYGAIGNQFSSQYGANFNPMQKIIAGRRLAAGKSVEVGGQKIAAEVASESSSALAEGIKTVTKAESTLEAAGGLSQAGSNFMKYGLPGIGLGTSLYSAFSAGGNEEQRAMGTVGAVGASSSLLGAAATAGALGTSSTAAAIGAVGGPIGWGIAAGMTLYSLLG